MTTMFNNSLNTKIIDFISQNGGIDDETFKGLDNKHEYISLFAKKGETVVGSKKKHLPINVANKLLIDIIKQNYSQGQLTYPSGTFLMGDVYNYLYIDFDYYSTSDNFESPNAAYAKFVESIILKHFDPKCILTFIPNVLTNDGGFRKCGFHINVFLKNAMTYSERQQAVESFKDKMLTDVNVADWWATYKSEVYAHKDSDQSCQLLDTFDEERFLSTSSHILPFCQKDENSRQYKLYSGHGVSNCDGVLIEPISKDLYNLCSKPNSQSAKRITMSDDEFSINMMRNIGQWLIDNHGGPWTKLDDIPPNVITMKRRDVIKKRLARIHQCNVVSSDLVDAEMFLYDFIDGVSSMDEKMPIIEAFKKGATFGAMNRYIIKILSFWFLLYSLANRIEYKEGLNQNVSTRRRCGCYDYDLVKKVPEIMMCLLMPLYIRGGKTDDTGVLDAIVHSIDYISPTNLKRLGPMSEFADIDIDFVQGGDDYFSAQYTPEEIYNFHAFAGMSEKERSSMKKKDHEEFLNMKRDYGMLLGKFKLGLNNWFKFVKDEIFDKITCEIEPFHPYTKSRDNFTFIDMDKNYSYFKEYNYQLSNLNKMFAFVLVGDTSVNFYESIIYKIIGKYIKNYVYIAKKNGSLKAEDKEVYVYNIRQTIILRKMPYNQWIMDNNDVLKNWITTIHNHTVAPIEHLTVTSDCGGLGGIVNLMFVNYKVLKTDTRNGINILEKFKSDGAKVVEQTYKYIVGYDSNTDQYIAAAPPFVDIPQKSEYMPTRNGLIHYAFDHATQTWRADFRKDNRNIILNAYTLAEYIPIETYDFGNPVYKHLMEIFSQIYPDEEEREYILNMYSTVACPMILKDQLLFLYGTGSDGKSTMNRIVENFLGHQDGTNIIVTEDGVKEHQIQLYNPFGCATTFKSSTLSVSEKGSNHNEGGIINFDKKTFAVAQEPPQRKIHTEIFKDFLSGSVTIARGIRQQAKPFVCNLLAVIETNQIPQFDIIDNAVRRRVVIYAHQSKFLTDATQQYKNKRYTFKADPEIIGKITTDARYWQALLEEFVRRCVKMLNTTVEVNGQRVKGIKQISNIKLPNSIRRTTESAFGRTSGLTKWLDSVLVETDKGFISVHDLVRNIKIRNSSTRDTRNLGKGFILDNRGDTENAMKEIKMTIQNKYEDRLFVLKTDAVLKESKHGSKKEVEIEKVRELEKLSKQLSLETMKANGVVEQYAIQTIDAGAYPDLRDVVIVGYDYNDEDDDVIELLNLGNDGDESYLE